MGNAFQDIVHLVSLQRSNPSLGLLQYDCLAAAVQYLKLFELTAKYVDKDSRVLDWGCGNGHFSYHLARSGYRVTAYTLEGIPPVLGWVEARDFACVQGNPKDPVALPFPDGTFKAVFSVGVLEHVRDSGGSETASLREILRILEPGGRFIAFHLPNVTSWVEFVIRLLPGRRGHARRFTPHGIARLFADAGFSILDVKRYGFFPRWALNRWPRGLTNALPFIRSLMVLDGLLSRALPPLCTNLYAVGKKA